MSPFRFGSHQRLLQSAQFESVFHSPDFKAGNRYLLLLAKANGAQHARLGLVIGKRHVRLAHERHRIKRLLREVFRLQQDNLHGLDIVAIARGNLCIEPRERQWPLVEQAFARLLTHRGDAVIIGADQTPTP